MSGEPLLASLERLEARFREREPETQAFVSDDEDTDARFERLRREARDLLRRYPDAENRPPLFGVPVGLKDVFHADGFPTRAGSRVPPEGLEGPESPAVTRLRQAGALILGKTVCTEFAWFAPGPTRNPHNPEHTPGGSSSGSAAAVAAGLSPLTLGTQTIGSVCRPAAFCGVVGFKPSYDRVSRDGLFPLAPSYDHVGWFTETVDEARRAASVLVPDWREDLEGWDVSTLRLAIPEGPLLERAEPVGLEHFRAVVETLRGAGITIEPVAALEDLDEIEARHGDLIAAEAAEVHRDLYARHPTLYHTHTAALIEKGRRISPDRSEDARRARETLRNDLEARLDRGHYDAWICPSTPGPAPYGLGATGDPAMNRPWTQAGLPAISIPSGANGGLPLGLQLVGRFGGDEGLLGVAGAVEGRM